MAEAAKTVLTKETLVPLSFVISFLVMVGGGIISHTTHANQIDALLTRQLEIRGELAKMEAKYISKELFDARFRGIEDNIAEIKELLKNKK